MSLITDAINREIEYFESITGASEGVASAKAVRFYRTILDTILDFCTNDTERMETLLNYRETLPKSYAQELLDDFINCNRPAYQLAEDQAVIVVRELIATTPEPTINKVGDKLFALSMSVELDCLIKVFAKLSK